MAGEEHYQLPPVNSIAELTQAIDVIFQRIGERIDQLEGKHGTSTIRDKLDIEDEDGNTLHGFNTTAST